MMIHECTRCDKNDCILYILNLLVFNLHAVVFDTNGEYVHWKR